MTHEVAGHVSNSETMDSCIGIEFDATCNQAVAYINEEEITLSCNQVWQLECLCAQVRNQMHWHDATWVYASRGSYSDTNHLMKKGEHDPRGKTLCGKSPSSVNGWTLTPVLGLVLRTQRSTYKGGSGGICQRCLASYDKQVATHQ